MTQIQQLAKPKWFILCNFWYLSNVIHFLKFLLRQNPRVSRSWEPCGGYLDDVVLVKWHKLARVGGVMSVSVFCSVLIVIQQPQGGSVQFICCLFPTVQQVERNRGPSVTRGRAFTTDNTFCLSFFVACSRWHNVLTGTGFTEVGATGSVVWVCLFRCSRTRGKYLSGVVWRITFTFKTRQAVLYTVILVRLYLLLCFFASVCPLSVFYLQFVPFLPSFLPSPDFKPWEQTNKTSALMWNYWLSLKIQVFRPFSKREKVLADRMELGNFLHHRGPTEKNPI